MPWILAVQPVTVDVPAFLALILTGLLMLGVSTGLLMLIKMAGQMKQLWDVHLGPRAIDDEGIPKWYVREHHFSDALARQGELVVDMKQCVLANTKVMTALLEELRIDRKVRDKVKEELSQKKE